MHGWSDWQVLRESDIDSGRPVVFVVSGVFQHHNLVFMAGYDRFFSMFFIQRSREVVTRGRWLRTFSPSRLVAKCVRLASQGSKGLCQTWRHVGLDLWVSFRIEDTYLVVHLSNRRVSGIISQKEIVGNMMVRYWILWYILATQILGGLSPTDWVRVPFIMHFLHAHPIPKFKASVAFYVSPYFHGCEG